MNEGSLCDDMRVRNRGRTVGGVIGIVVILLLTIAAVSGPVAAHSGDDGAHHHDGWMGTHDGMGGWMGAGLGVFWMLLWTTVLIGIPLTLGYLLFSRRETADGRADDALDVLRRRYAQGEIDEEEFETRRRILLAERE